jgi:tetratricopeptide (TPR) repeat protein
MGAALERARQAAMRGTEVKILLDQATILDWTSDWTRSKQLFEEADTIVKQQPDLATANLQARLLMARGRTLVRNDRPQEGLGALRAAVEAAGQLGDAEYETYTQSLSMQGYVAATLGQIDEAEQAMSRCLAAFEEHGDMIGLAGALVNRCSLSLFTNKIERMLADYKRAVQVAREYGFFTLECLVIKDLAEVNFILGRPDEAEPNAVRAVEMFIQMFGADASRTANAEVLLARIKWYRGEVGSAAQIVQRVLARQDEAQAAGRADAMLNASERLALDVVDLALRPCAELETDAAFDKLIARARELSLQPQDVVEMIEFKALSALRAGRRPDAERYLADALAEAEKNAQLAADRVRSQIGASSGAASARAQA